MRKTGFLLLVLMSSLASFAQELLTPETLLKIGRVSAQGFSSDGSMVYYSVSVPDLTENKNKTKFYAISLQGGEAKELASLPRENVVTVEQQDAENIKVSSDGRKVIYTKEVKVAATHSTERYKNLSKSNVYVYDDLNQRHWDTWEDGAYSHIFLADVVAGFAVREKDLFEGLAFDCPQKPHGGEEDLLFTPDGKEVIYVTKKKSGKEYALSTNTDIYAYTIATGETRNLTEGMEGYDTNPAFSSDARYMAWQSMEHDGFESDKNDLWVMNLESGEKTNLTKDWDGTVASFQWSTDNKQLFFIAAVKGTEQLFRVEVGQENSEIRMLTSGQFDINGIAGQQGSVLVLSRTDMNHAAELYTYDLTTSSMKQLTHVNDAFYSRLALCDVKERYTTLDNGDQLFSWVIYPPNFDPTKKYPLLLYCQGGPQSALSQFYSYRWNFQLMASQGYIVIAPNRTGMPGWGVKWNEAISKDWGGDPMRDYLAAVDDISTESYVDQERRGAVGASYGGYSVFMLAGIHENRFKTFISHCGLFDLKSWYGTTEELWFANWDVGGPYWDKSNTEAQKSYKFYSPSNYVQNWNTPILVIQGGKDFRVPIEQGLQAFQAAQLKGLKSRFLLLPDENHWVLKPQNAMVWHTEFYRWLKETL